MVAEFESDLIRLRTREGMKVAKAKGRLRDKHPKLKPNQAKHLVELHDSGNYTQAELAELFGVGRSTIYRTIDRMRLHPSNPSGRSPTSCRRSRTPKSALRKISVERLKCDHQLINGAHAEAKQEAPTLLRVHQKRGIEARWAFPAGPERSCAKGAVNRPHPGMSSAHRRVQPAATTTSDLSSVAVTRQSSPSSSCSNCGSR